MAALVANVDLHYSSLTRMAGHESAWVCKKKRWVKRGGRGECAHMHASAHAGVKESNDSQQRHILKMCVYN